MASGKRYRAKGHILPGLVGYPEREDIGTLYVPRETIEKMRRSFIGKPVVNEAHSNLSAEELLDFSKEELEEIAAGIVSDAGVDEEGIEYVDFVVWDEETMDNLDKRKYSVSNSYDPLEVDFSGGDLNGVPFDTKLLQGAYRHLAIVPNPRYDDIAVFENSKPEPKEKVMSKLFKFRKAEPVKNADPAAPEVEEIDKENTYCEINGEKVPMSELEAMYKDKMAQPAENEGVLMNADDEVEIDGKKVKVSELMNMYQNGCGVKNAEVPINDPAELDVDEEKQDAVQNSKKPVNKKVRTALDNGAPMYGPAVETKSDRLKAGKERYSKGGK